ncbi:hypothetical protein WJX72_009148 [[Myrmecia] bisecta]|uniref:Uncharacterized protein n=1 Tax=[Myrmecia] bisecta TaxID=41462 RepID=A0AAW1R8W6_9CHLO
MVNDYLAQLQARRQSRTSSMLVLKYPRTAQSPVGLSLTNISHVPDSLAIKYGGTVSAVDITSCASSSDSCSSLLPG